MYVNGSGGEHYTGDDCLNERDQGNTGGQSRAGGVGRRQGQGTIKHKSNGEHATGEQRQATHTRTGPERSQTKCTVMHRDSRREI